MTVETKVKSLRKTLREERAAARARTTREDRARVVAEAGPKAKAKAERAKGRMVRTKTGNMRWKPYAPYKAKKPSWFA